MVVPGALPRIHVLPLSLANQIAAGEVVERPASIVKELVENSLDAGATRVDVQAREGGIGAIRVVDNGCGIHADDLQLALQRHATSKIHVISDLARVRSLGFRGEALPSIASVSRFRLASRAAGAEHGAELQIEPGTGKFSIHPVAHPFGTTVEVTQLFHTVPARRRFLRTARTEFLQLQDTVRRLALSRWNAAINFVHDGRVVLNCGVADAGADLRIEQVIGRRFIQRSQPVEYSAGGMRLHGRLGDPESARSQTDCQYLFVNGRVVRDRQLSHAIRLGFGDVIASDRFPAYVLYLDIDAAAVDVNVHPTKQEVRFRHARDAHDFIFAGVRGALAGAPVAAPPMQTAPAGADPAGPPLRTPGLLRDAQSPYRPVVRAETQPGRVTALLAGGRFAVMPQGEDGLLVDVQAVRRALLRQRFQACRDSGAPAVRRPLLVPVELDVSAAGAKLLDSHAAALCRLGLVLERRGTEFVRVREIPGPLADCDLPRLVTRLLLVLPAVADSDITELLADAGAQATSTSPDDLAALLENAVAGGIGPDSGAAPGLWRLLTGPDLEQLLRDHD